MRNEISSDQPVPAGWRLRLDPEIRVFDGGAVILGGSPLRVLRLSAAGADVVRRWSADRPVGTSTAERRLARVLLDGGLAHPDPPPAGDLAQLTVVVPVCDRPAGLERCLAAIERRCATLVVDDGSADSSAIAAVAQAAGASLLRIERARGPAAARNVGLHAVRTPFVAFIDSDCVVAADFPGRLLDHLGDPAVAVAVPRIVALDRTGGGALARYEARRSALDMGRRPALIRPGSTVPYAPSAAMVARVDALESGFDEALRVGEDVDLVWRIIDAGGRVVYDPAVTVAHDHRVAWGAWFARRVAYNASTAMLHRRHPGNVPALTVTRSGGAFWLALAAGRPGVAAGVCALDTARLTRALRGRVPGSARAAAVLIARGRLHEARHVARAVGGPWLPFLLARSLARPRARRALWVALAAGAVGRGRDAAPYAAEGVARCAGIWLGCLRERTAGPLLPTLRR